MQKIFKNILTIFIMSLFLWSCNKNEDKPVEDNNTNVSNDDKSSLSATVNNVDMKATLFNATEITQLNEVNIVAYLTDKNYNGDHIQITVDKDIVSGTYSFNVVNNVSEDYFIYGYYHVGIDDSATFESGTLTINSHDKTANIIKGTFNFTTSVSETSSKSWVATSGVFEVYYD